MKTLLALSLILIALSATVGCGEDSPAAPGEAKQEAEVSFRKVPNVALYSGANYAGNMLYKVTDGDVTTCAQMCEDDPECNYFFFNERGALNIGANSTSYRDCAFFRGKLWAGSAPQSDTYVKQLDETDAWDLAKGRF